LESIVAAYVRVSSKAQSVKTQRDAITRAAKARGWVISEWYSEQVSTRNARPELDRLKNDVRAGRLAKLFVFKLDRLSRGTICEMLNVINEFKAHGCQIESVADALPLTNGPMDEFIIAGIALCAAMEREAMQERVAAARLRVEASGGSWGRPRRLSDHQRGEARELRRGGKSIRSIAGSMNVPFATIQRAVKGIKPRRTGSDPA
jgi:DNA invertase Pin-like site-specific DNA recombinase